MREGRCFSVAAPRRIGYSSDDEGTTDRMNRFQPAFYVALAAFLLLAAGSFADKTLPDAPPLPDLAFRVVDETADPAAIFGADTPIPDGFEPVADGDFSLWRRVGPPPDNEELDRIARSSDRPGCDLLLEKRIVDGETLYAPLFVRRHDEFTGQAVYDARFLPRHTDGPPSLGFEFNRQNEFQAMELWRRLRPDGNQAPPYGRLGGRIVVLADGRLLGVARVGLLSFYPYVFTCNGNSEAAEAVVKAYHRTTPTHLFTASPLKTSGLSATEARDRAVEDMRSRVLAIMLDVADAHLIRVTPEGESGIAIVLPPLTPMRQQMLLAVFTVPMSLVFRPVAPESDAWVRDLFDAAPPDGFETVTAPDGAPAWNPLATSPDNDENDGDDDDDNDGNPDLGSDAERNGCLLAWENLRLGTDIPPDKPGPAYAARRPCYLSAGTVLDILSVDSLAPDVSADGSENVIRVELLPDDRAALEDMARALAPGQRIAFLYNDRIHALHTADDILSGAPILIRYSPIGGFDAPTPKFHDSFISLCIHLFQAGAIPADLTYEGSRDGPEEEQ